PVGGAPQRAAPASGGLAAQRGQAAYRSFVPRARPPRRAAHGIVLSRHGRRLGQASRAPGERRHEPWPRLQPRMPCLAPPASLHWLQSGDELRPKFPGVSWFRRGLRSRLAHAEGAAFLVNPAAKLIVANDDNYALAA